MQVITNANMVDVIQGKPIPDFKPPEAPKAADAKPEVKVDADPAAKTDGAAPDKAAGDQVERPRDEGGKFKKAGEEPAGDEKKPGVEDDVVLTRKIEKLINKKHREMREAQEFGTTEARRAIAAEQRADALQRQIDELQGKKSDGAKPAGDEPKPEDFKTVGDYTRALVKYEAKQAGQKSAAHTAAERQQAQANEVIGQFVERQEAFMKATPDYEEVLESADFEVPPAAQRYLVESDVGPQLAYHLAKNPDVVTSLRKLSPARQIAELGKLEAKFEVKTEAAPGGAPAPKNDVSKAPAPIQPLEAKSTPVQKKPEEMSFQELRQFRREQERAKRA